MNLLTKEFETSKCRLLAINLPEGAKWIQISEKTLCWVDDYAKEFTLPPGDWEILNVTEEKAREVVDGNNGGQNDTMWFDYIQPETCFFCFTKSTALESFDSLLKSEIKTVNKYGEKPPDPEAYFNTNLPVDQFTDQDSKGLDKYGSDLMFWEEEQATVFDNYIILISKK